MRKVGHVAVECLDSKALCGTISACPLCNTNDHPLDRCQEIADRKYSEYHALVGDLVRILVDDRANAPQVHSKDWTFYDVLFKAVGVGIQRPDKVLEYPWSREFTRKIMAAPSDDPILQGKVHPRDFIHGEHDISHLPVDPLFTGKTVLEIINMSNSGELKSDRLGEPLVP